MIHNIRQAFNEILDENDWMDEETKIAAKEKANAMSERIGYSEILTNPVEVSKEYENVGLSRSLDRQIAEILILINSFLSYFFLATSIREYLLV